MRPSDRRSTDRLVPQARAAPEHHAVDAQCPPRQLLGPDAVALPLRLRDQRLPAHACCRSRSTRVSHCPTQFQLAKVRVTADKRCLAADLCARSGSPHRGCQPGGLAAVPETGLMWANMLRAFQVGKALTSDGEPSIWMRPSRVAWAHASWPACRLTKASASAAMGQALFLAHAGRPPGGPAHHPRAHGLAEEPDGR